MVLADLQQLYTADPGKYWHSAYVVQDCRFSGDNQVSRGDSVGTVILRLGESENISRDISVHAIGPLGLLLSGANYTMIRLGGCWIVSEVVGERDIAGTSAFEAVKWTVLHINEEDSEHLVQLAAKQHRVRITYLSPEEALRRSAFSNVFVAVSPSPRIGYHSSG